MKVTHVSLFAVSLLISALPSAHAQPVLPPPPTWSEIVLANVAPILERAERAEQDGDMETAIEAYEEANARGECVAVGVELGLALLRAGRTVQGARQLRYALLHSPLPLSHRSPAYITRQLEEAKSKVGTLLIRTNVDRVSLEVDGTFRWEYPRMVEIYVDPEKEHKIRARREGYWTAFTTEKVGAGEVKDVLMAMEPQVMQKVVKMPTPLMANVSGQLPKQEESKTLLYVSAAGLGISVAAGIVGAVVWNNGDKQGNPAMSTAGTALLIGGGIGFGLSMTGFLIYVATPRPQPQPIITISPAVSRNQMGLGLQGTW
ncbi:tetratricopeptide repeat protein [Polyangium aurulentum]|uniref:tetratricopeptide repeat protein n=1 Tax=Polyangium aurulentum TaxID=2567896 RepID=UPI0010AE83A5|nr:hypothetical protein [Polyangium aurulentum]UQA55671.1 hypothetical protein E8A73_030585 [Polyangium aurulentum]